MRTGKVSCNYVKTKLVSSTGYFFPQKYTACEQYKKKERQQKSVLLLKRSKSGHFKAQLKQRRVIISLQIVRKKTRKEDDGNVEFIRIINHSFVFKQRLNPGIRYIKDFDLFLHSRNWDETTTK